MDHREYLWPCVWWSASESGREASGALWEKCVFQKIPFCSSELGGMRFLLDWIHDWSSLPQGPSFSSNTLRQLYAHTSRKLSRPGNIDGTTVEWSVSSSLGYSRSGRNSGIGTTTSKLPLCSSAHIDTHHLARTRTAKPSRRKTLRSPPLKHLQDTEKSSLDSLISISSHTACSRFTPLRLTSSFLFSCIYLRKSRTTTPK